jgi:integrase
MPEYLDEEEIKKLIISSSSVQTKAIIACMYETGARPEEFLNLQNTDIEINSNGAAFRIFVQMSVLVDVIQVLSVPLLFFCRCVE